MQNVREAKWNRLGQVESGAPSPVSCTVQKISTRLRISASPYGRPEGAVLTAARMCTPSGRDSPA